MRTGPGVISPRGPAGSRNGNDAAQRCRTKARPVPRPGGTGKIEAGRGER